MSKTKSEEETPIPEFVQDVTNGKKYARGKFLGKGGFARCFELTDLATKEVFAAKIVPKKQLLKSQQKEKISLEISIHRSLHHKNIVGFQGFFEDKSFIYIVLELCSGRSLMEMQRRRKIITDPEIRYFARQIAQAGAYLHEKKCIHRDLKLGNLFLNKDMELKVGDFGLAARIDFNGERKKTLCGTPNYIAPEILNKNGHSFEVDVWSLGCIVYALAVGKPPFETATLKETYTRIKNNEYHIPSTVTLDTRNFIKKLLRSDPHQRPSMVEILDDPYLTKFYVPSRIPPSCLSTAPRFETRLSFCLSNETLSTRKPLHQTNVNEGQVGQQNSAANVAFTAAERLNEKISVAGYNCDYYKCLVQLATQVTSVIQQKPHEKETIQLEEAEDPAGAPIFWISKWVDYSDKYGLGYQLCDNSVGVVFNDITRIVLPADSVTFQYIERNGNELFYTLENYPESLNKKTILMKYFKNYMSEHLLQAGDRKVVPREGDELTRLPYLVSWFRTRSAIVLFLTNGTLQINFFEDHTKLILCPLMGAVTYINKEKKFCTYRMKLMEKFGCSQDLFTRLKYAKVMIDRLAEFKQSLHGKIAVPSTS